MILDKIDSGRVCDVYLTKSLKVWAFPGDTAYSWRTATDPWPTEREWSRGLVKLLGPTALVIWSKEDD